MLGRSLLMKASGATILGGDSSFASVSLLLHGDGANGSTTIIDSSPSPKTVTAVGNAQISTAQSKYGSGSIAFDGNGDYLTTIGGDLGANDFTVEAWVYLNSSGNYASIVGTRINSASSPIRWTLAVGPSRQLVFFTDNFRVNSGTINLGVWTHLAVTKKGSELRGFIDGTQTGATVTNTQNFTEAALYIGNMNNNSEPLDGNVDDLRITKGVARYTANFTPPTAPFPDS